MFDHFELRCYVDTIEVMITHYYIHALEQQIYPARLYVMQGLTLCIDASNVFNVLIWLNMLAESENED